MEKFDSGLELAMISFLTIFIAYVPSIRTLSNLKEIELPIVTWVIFSLSSFVILFSSYSSGGLGLNLLAPFAGLIGSTTIMLLVLLKSKNRKVSFWDYLCGTLSIGALISWLVFLEDPERSKWVLVLSLVANFFGLIPAIRNAWIKPHTDRPYLWFVFGLGYGLMLLVIPNWNLEYSLLPSYMFLGCIPVWLPLVIYRLNKKIPLKKWI
ncbi:MAG: hypothetical protein KC516_02035 [Nanoarchaeota archaeon]|nr:hypothetical protein [Nanoarchaeota archaeon]